MKDASLLPLVALLLLASCAKPDSTVYSFSGLKWSDGPAEVHKKLTKANFSTDDDPSPGGDPPSAYSGQIDDDAVRAYVGYSPQKVLQSVFVDSNHYLGYQEGGEEVATKISEDSYQYCMKFVNRLTEKYGKQNEWDDKAANEDYIKSMQKNDSVDFNTSRWVSGDESIFVLCRLGFDDNFHTLVHIEYYIKRSGGSL